MPVFDGPSRRRLALLAGLLAVALAAAGLYWMGRSASLKPGPGPAPIAAEAGP